MPQATPGLFLLRALAILLALSALTGWVIFRSVSAPREEARTRASSSKAQTVSAMYAAAIAAGADVESAARHEQLLNEIVEASRKETPDSTAGGSEEGPPDKNTFFPGTKSEVLISPAELLGLWPTPGPKGDWTPAPLLSEEAPDDLQTTDNPP